MQSTALLRHGRPKDHIKRDDIIAAGSRLFMENGFELTSMDAIARAAGVSKLTIYSHFKDKNDLFVAIMQQRCDRLGMPENFASLSDFGPEPALLHIAITAAAVIYHPDSLRLQRVIYGEAARHPEIAKIFYESGPKRIKTAFMNLLILFDGQGKLRVLDPIRATEQFFSLLKGEKLMPVLLMIHPVPTVEELAAHVRTVVSFFINAYLPKTDVEPS